MIRAQGNTAVIAAHPTEIKTLAERSSKKSYLLSTMVGRRRLQAAKK